MYNNSNANTSRLSWVKRIGLILSLILICAISSEVAARAFWRLKFDVPFRNPGTILYAYYPYLKHVDFACPSHNDDIYDILLLGGSVLHDNWGKVEQALREQLASEGYQKVRIFNLAMPAQTSRDSWLKYAALDNSYFDLVIFYHGINEARANNVPPDLFRKDYSHYFWYDTINALAPYHKKRSLALPHTIKYIATRIKQRLNNDRYISQGAPRQEWLQYAGGGGRYRSAEAFETNLKAILDLASQRGDRVLLMTFAIHVPEDYSLEAFKEKRLDYSLHITPIEVVGDKNNVIGAVASHNEVISRLSKEYSNVLFVDQASVMNNYARYFNDICHFTLLGSSKFVENLLPVLLPIMEDKQTSNSNK